MQFFRFIFYLSPINKNQANIEVRQARHAKLETENTTVEKSSTPQKKSFFSFLPKFNSKTTYSAGGSSKSPALLRMSRKMMALTAAFLVISSFGPLYHLTEGQGHDGVSFIDFEDEETRSILQDIMTEDGFLLKPALNSTQGDRSTANEIFAYQVEPGDTLSSLAQRFGIKKETIAMENDLWNTNSLRSGMTLKILPVDGISHLVKKGDTVAKIASKYKIEKEIIVRQNQLEDVEELDVDIALIIPGAKKAVKAPVRYQNTAPNAPSSYAYTGGSSGRLIWPTLGSAKLTQGFHRGHYALDIGNRAKGPIFASAAGRVIRADYGWNGGYGNMVIVDHGNGMQTLYAHNEKLYVAKGQYVEQGQTLAWMGRSGRVYGPTGIHLHFEVRINGVKYDPRNFF